MKTHKIAIDSTIHFGQPCIAGTRIPVYCILELVKADIPFNEIIARYYPNITAEDIKACVQYAIDVVKSEEVEAVAGQTFEDWAKDALGLELYPEIQGTMCLKHNLLPHIKQLHNMVHESFRDVKFIETKLLKDPEISEYEKICFEIHLL